MEDFVPVKPSRAGIPLIPDIRYHVEAAWSETGMSEWRLARTGFRIRDLFDDGEGCQVVMARLDPGAEISPSMRHAHEHLFVLAGKLLDGDGEYGAGTYLLNPPGSSHRLWTHGGCLLLIHRMGPMPVPASEDSADPGQAGYFGRNKEGI